LAIVAAGARTDLGQLDAAVAELEIPQLDINRAFSYSPRLFRAYADALSAVGREDEAAKWQKQAIVAENALGLGVDEEPDIVDLGWDEEEEAREETERRRLIERAARGPETDTPPATPAPEASTGSAVPAGDGPDTSVDDAESDYFESDDSESDEDSIEQDELESSDDGDAEDVPEEPEGYGGDDAEAGHAERRED
jgi:hypothetical protein